jgi:hypothetical protein
MASQDDVRRLALSLPEATESSDRFAFSVPNGFPAILVRLAAVDAVELAELLTDGWRCQAPRALVKQYDG